LAEDLSGVVVGGNFDHKDFRENKVFPCIVKSNIMLLKDLLFRVIFVLIFA
jgi:hypothetical protein